MSQCPVSPLPFVRMPIAVGADERGGGGLDEVDEETRDEDADVGNVITGRQPSKQEGVTALPRPKAMTEAEW